MARSTTVATILNDIREATFSDYDPQRAARMNKARTVLLAMQPEDQEHFAGLIGAFMRNVGGRGLGPVTAFEILVALANLLERNA